MGSGIRDGLSWCLYLQVRNAVSAVVSSEGWPEEVSASRPSHVVGGRTAFPVGCQTESLDSLVAVAGGWSPPSTPCPTGLSTGYLAAWPVAATSAGGGGGHASWSGIQPLSPALRVLATTFAALRSLEVSQ